MNVLITGANSGFGLLTAQLFAQSGHVVHAGYRSLQNAGELEQLATANPQLHMVRLDVTDQATISSAVAEAQAAGPIDVLVNNAGFELVSPVDSLSDTLLLRQFDTNVLGVIRMIRAISPQMRERKQGTIINLSSIVGWLTLPYTSAYAASKHAIESFSEGLWFELAPFGIRVAVVEPGAFPTSFNSNVVTEPSFNEGSPHWPHAQRFRAALARVIESSHADAKPQEVADLIYEAATTNAPRFRYVAGNDARALIPAYKSQEFESYSAATLAHLGLTDWQTVA